MSTMDEARKALAELPRAVSKAPERIWLQISDDADHLNEPFPHGEEVTWCQDSVTAAQVEYVRADLASAPPAAQPSDRSLLSWGGFNVHGDSASIRAVADALHSAGTVPELKQRIREDDVQRQRIEADLRAEKTSHLNFVLDLQRALNGEPTIFDFIEVKAAQEALEAARGAAQPSAPETAQMDGGMHDAYGDGFDAGIERRDADWVLAMARGLGTDSGYSVPIEPSAEAFKSLFAAVRAAQPSAPAQPLQAGEAQALAAEIKRLNACCIQSYYDMSDSRSIVAQMDAAIDRLAALSTPPQDSHRQELTQAAQDVLAERRRQVEAEGWTPEHDDEHDDGAMACAAAGYAFAAYYATQAVKHEFDGPGEPPIDDEARQAPASPWPYGWQFKPAPPRRQLIKAAALILAEIERLDRASTQPEEPNHG